MEGTQAAWLIDKTSLLEDPRTHATRPVSCFRSNGGYSYPQRSSRQTQSIMGRVHLRWFWKCQWADSCTKTWTKLWFAAFESLFWWTSSGILIVRPLPSIYPTHRNRLSPSRQHPTNKINTHPTFTYSIAWPVLLKSLITANWTWAYSYQIICGWCENDIYWLLHRRPMVLLFLEMASCFLYATIVEILWSTIVYVLFQYWPSHGLKTTQHFCFFQVIWNISFFETLLNVLRWIWPCGRH